MVGVKRIFDFLDDRISVSEVDEGDVALIRAIRRGDRLLEVVHVGIGVVADVVDAIKHQHVNIIIKWDEHKAENQSQGDSLAYAYYVRFAGDMPANVPDCSVVAFSESGENEFAVLTEPKNKKQIDEFVNSLENCTAVSIMRII